MGTVPGRLSGAIIVTPLCSLVWPGLVSAQLPPDAPARSTITEPSRIPATASSVMSKGARFPGTCAVLMTRSEVLACSAINLEKLCAERTYLLAGGGANVIALDDCSQAAGRRNSLQTGDSGAQDENSRGGHRPRGRGEHGKDTRQLCGAKQHSLVTGDRRHGRECVHGLRPGCPR